MVVAGSLADRADRVDTPCAGRAGDPAENPAGSAGARGRGGCYGGFRSRRRPWAGRRLLSDLPCRTSHPSRPRSPPVRPSTARSPPTRRHGATRRPSPVRGSRPRPSRSPRAVGGRAAAESRTPILMRSRARSGPRCSPQSDSAPESPEPSPAPASDLGLRLITLALTTAAMRSVSVVASAASSHPGSEGLWARGKGRLGSDTRSSRPGWPGRPSARPPLDGSVPCQTRQRGEGVARARGHRWVAAARAPADRHRSVTGEGSGREEGRRGSGLAALLTLRSAHRGAGRGRDRRRAVRRCRVGCGRGVATLPLAGGRMPCSGGVW